MTPVVAAFLAAQFLVPSTVASASGADCPPGVVCTEGNGGAFDAGLNDKAPPTVGDNRGGATTAGSIGPHWDTWSCAEFSNCSFGAICPDGTIVKDYLVLVSANGTFIRSGGPDCPTAPAEPSQAAPPPALTEGRILTAFERLEMPAAVLHTQPKGHETLVNAKTIFYATGQEHLSRTVRLLGRQVDFRIHVTGYTWNYDDGETETTDWPGEAFTSMANLDHDITHSYDHHGHYEPSVDVVYAADYRVNGGPWRQVNGTVAVPGPPQALEVYEATAVRTG